MNDTIYIHGHLDSAWRCQQPSWVCDAAWDGFDRSFAEFVAGPPAELETHIIHRTLKKKKINEIEERKKNNWIERTNGLNVNFLEDFARRDFLIDLKVELLSLEETNEH